MLGGRAQNELAAHTASEYPITKPQRGSTAGSEDSGDGAAAVLVPNGVRPDEPLVALAGFGVMATCPCQFAGQGVRADDRSARTRAAECRSARGVAEEGDPAGGPTGTATRLTESK